MRVVAWNIRAGGAPRSAGIVERLVALRAEVAVVSGVRSEGDAAKLRGHLDEAGYGHQVAVDPPSRGTGLLVASTGPVTVGLVEGSPVPASWLHVEGLPFELGAVHGPIGQGDPASVGARRAWWDWLAGAVADWRDRPALLCGSFPEAFPGGAPGVAAGGERLDGWHDLSRVVRGPWSAEGPSSRGDRAFASPTLGGRVRVTSADGAGLAEHRPFVLDLDACSLDAFATDPFSRFDPFDVAC